MTAKQSRLLVLLSCWIATLSASDLPAIIWHALMQRPEVSVWIPVSQLVGLAIALVLTLTSSAFRSVRGFVWALLALAIGDWICYGIEITDVWTNWASTLAGYERMFMRTLLSLIPASLMTLTLFGSGIGKRELFLTKGVLNAPSKMPFGNRSIPWTLLGPILITIFTLPLILQLTLTVHPDFSMGARVIRALPFVLLFAIVNAASEEFRFRSVLLARIQTVVGPGHALLLTSALFGLAHWFGHPSGLTGVLMAGFAGWFWGKAMIETKGFIWSWLIHAIQDVAIAAFIIMAST